MLLKSVSVSHFKNILDAADVQIQPDVTCIVGKNESGKTAFLQCVHRLNPAQPNATFNAQRQYPAWLEKQHRRQKDLGTVEPITATFELTDSEWAIIADKFGRNALPKKEVMVARSYGDSVRYEFEINEASIISRMLGGISVVDYGGTPTTLDAVSVLINRLGTETYEDEADTKKARETGKAIATALKEVLGDAPDVRAAVEAELEEFLPLFFYFDEYSQLPGSVKIKPLLEKNKKDLSAPDLTARSLLEMAGADNEYLLNPDYETRKRELENVANAITHDVLHYWSTNPELRTEIDITLERVTVPNGQQQVLDELKLRLYDNRHLLSNPFEERSTGFRWFFSFLAAFSAYENDKRPLIILLDEPGLGLHARAQADFLRFIDERLGKKCQVIYSTHSPFMVQPGKLERVRLVEDTGRDVGSRITANVLMTDRDTLFPLQGALGYDMVQHLFIAPHNLVVEGTSDFVYLSLLSEFLRDRGRTALHPKWSIVPVGGADLIPSFVALLGRHLNVSVLVDSRREGHQRLQQLAQQGILKDTGLVTIGSVIGRKAGDIEDLFEPSEYLELFNEAYGKDYGPGDMIGSDPVVKRLARLLGVERFDHGKPATVLLRRQADFLPRLLPATTARFEALFAKINATLT